MHQDRIVEIEAIENNGTGKLVGDQLEIGVSKPLTEIDASVYQLST